MEYCCHFCASAASYYLELLNKLQKQICRTFDPSLATSLEPLAHCRNVASLSLFYGYYFGRCSSELAQLVPLSYSQERLTCYSDRLHDSVTIPRCYKDVYVNSFFPCNLRRKKLHRTNQESNFEPQSNLEEKVNPSFLKDDFSSRADPSIFT